MKQCPKCSQELNDDAVKCNSCGEPVEKTAPEKQQTQGEYSKEERTLAMWCHLGAFAGIFVPFGNLLAPLILWLTRKEDNPLVDDQGKESLNFQISIFIYSLVGIVLTFVIIGIVFLVVLFLFALIQVIKAAMAANNGIKYRYPLCIKIIK